VHILDLEERSARFRQLQDESWGIFKSKNRDYGDAFKDTGIIGLLIRIFDKLARAISISRKSIVLVTDEALRDTCIDGSNYLLMIAMLLDEGIDEK
jgi:hypothetical protein